MKIIKKELRSLGHALLTFENGMTLFVSRGEHEKFNVGDTYAVEQGHVEVEVGQSALGQQEGSQSQEPEASDSDHVVGEKGSEGRQEGISST